MSCLQLLFAAALLLLWWGVDHGGFRVGKFRSLSLARYFESCDPVESRINDLNLVGEWVSIVLVASCRHRLLPKLLTISEQVLFPIHSINKHYQLIQQVCFHQNDSFPLQVGFFLIEE